MTEQQLPPEVIAQLTAMGPMITPGLVQDSWALLTPFHEKAGYAAPRIDRDQRYGDHERHRLDVHTSGAGVAGDRAPVVLFVHGGGFTGGDKRVPGTPMYDHIGAWAVRNGWVGVTMTYRLAPGHRWPAGAEDVARAVEWVRDNIAAYGGDPGRIVVVGHSAGCVHVASYLVGHGGGALDGVAGPACCPASTRSPTATLAARSSARITAIFRRRRSRPSAACSRPRSRCCSRSRRATRRSATPRWPA